MKRPACIKDQHDECTGGNCGCPCHRRCEACNGGPEHHDGNGCRFHWVYRGANGEPFRMVALPTPTCSHGEPLPDISALFTDGKRHYLTACYCAS